MYQSGEMTGKTNFDHRYQLIKYKNELIYRIIGDSFALIWNYPSLADFGFKTEDYPSDVLVRNVLKS